MKIDCSSLYKQTQLPYACAIAGLLAAIEKHYQYKLAIRFSGRLSLLITVLPYRDYDCLNACLVKYM